MLRQLIGIREQAQQPAPGRVGYGIVDVSGG
jgi:hypothetical protein